MKGYSKGLNEKTEDDVKALYIAKPFVHFLYASS